MPPPLLLEWERGTRVLLLLLLLQGEVRA